ncbi:preprotein translocase subunit SecY, partial [Mycobacterium tuberculosis]
MTFVLECFTLESKKGVITYGLMIVVFTLFYSHVQLNPERVAEHLGKANGYIVGVRPGLDTEKYVSKKLNKLSFISSVYLILVSVVPLNTLL